MSALENVRTLAECDQSVQLKAIAESGACEAGRVIMLDFTQVRERVGSRWTVKCEAIWEHTERTIRRHILSTAIFCRADQVTYVISFADMDGFGAQALGFRIMQDVITHFLGDCSSKDLLIKTVSSVSENEIVSSPVSFRAEHLAYVPSISVSVAPEQPARTMPQLVQVVDGQLQQLFEFEHVFNVKMEKPVALRISSSLKDLVKRHPLTSQEQSSLPTRTLFHVDLNTFDVLEYIFSSMPPKLILAPISMQTMTNTKSRAALLNFMRKLDCEVRSRFIVEIYGLEDGTPTSRLTEITALIRPFCRAAMARITPSRSAISNVRAARLPAVSICAADAGASPGKFASRLLTAGEATRGLAPMVMATDLPDKCFLSVCAVAGITHAAVKSSQDTAGV